MEFVGQPIRRREDSHLITGRARWADNLRVEDQLHLGILRSPLAHGRIVDIDVTRALRQPGVVAAYTGRDLEDLWVGTLPVAGPSGAHKPRQLPVAVSKVRFVGEPVAVVVAGSAAQAIDALEAIDLDLDAYRAVLELDGQAVDDTLIHEDAGTNEAFAYEGARRGDIGAAFAEADVVVARRFEHPRVMGVALEPRAVVAVPNADGVLDMHVSTQAPHRIRDLVADVLGRDRDSVRAIALDVGGGFGPKLDCYPEDLLCAALAVRHGRAVRYTPTRSDDLQSTHHGRGQVQYVEVAARRDGTLLGLRVRVTGDCGAYLSRVGANIPINGDKVFPGCYRWQAYEFAASGVFTNAVPTAAYRGAGRPEAIYAVERAIDELAAELSIDPAELRRRNFPRPDDFPFASIGGLTYDSGAYEAALDVALDAIDYGGVRQEQQRRRDAADPVVLGVGLSAYVDRCGTGPGLPENSVVRVDADGHVDLVSGLGPSGQGTMTSLAQIVADELGVDLAQIRTVHGDTALVESGNGTFGSRSMSVGGVAALGAAKKVAAEARRRAADDLEAAAADIELVAGTCRVRGSPDAAVSLFGLATSEALEEADAFDPPGLTFPFGVHVAVAEVDTATGQVTLRRFVAVDDSGRIINPALADGQVLGGLAQGVGQALFEQVALDQDGNPLTGTLLDYHVAGAPDLPMFELHRTVTPSNNELGVKGIGESGTIGAPAAVVNAALDAVRFLGVEDLQMPCTPEQIWRAIQAAVTASSEA